MGSLASERLGLATVLPPVLPTLTITIPGAAAGGGLTAAFAGGDETELAGRRRRAALSLHPRDQCVGNLEVGGDVLDVVVVLELADQSQDLLARLVVDRNRVLRPPDERRLARFAVPSLERLLRLGQRLDRGDHLVLFGA